MAKTPESDEVTELRDLLRRALDEGDPEARQTVIKEAAMGVLAVKHMDDLGDVGRAMAAESQDVQSQLNL